MPKSPTVKIFGVVFLPRFSSYFSGNFIELHFYYIFITLLMSDSSFVIDVVDSSVVLEKFFFPHKSISSILQEKEFRFLDVACYYRRRLHHEMIAVLSDENHRDVIFSPLARLKCVCFTWVLDGLCSPLLVAGEPGERRIQVTEMPSDWFDGSDWSGGFQRNNRIFVLSIRKNVINENDYEVSIKDNNTNATETVCLSQVPSDSLDQDGPVAEEDLRIIQVIVWKISTWLESCIHHLESSTHFHPRRPYGISSRGSTTSNRS